jgi:hypothetical protein
MDRKPDTVATNARCPQPTERSGYCSVATHHASQQQGRASHAVLTSTRPRLRQIPNQRQYTFAEPARQKKATPAHAEYDRARHMTQRLDGKLKSLVGVSDTLCATSRRVLIPWPRRSPRTPRFRPSTEKSDCCSVATQRASPQRRARYQLHSCERAAAPAADTKPNANTHYRHQRSKRTPPRPTR